jgi:Ni/Fe-hydrogenase subunit HybB-like protein
MIWNPVRRSVWGPAILATSVLIGTLLDRIRLYVASWDVAGRSMAKELEMKMQDVPTKIQTPGYEDIFIMVGFIAGSILIFMLATRLIPAVNLWEQKEMLLYKAEIQFHRTKVTVMGKPR